MRIRQVKPAYFKDARMAALSPAVRLFYIGLWMVADDAGWLKWDAAEIGNELYGYETRHRRERNARDFLAVLDEVGRVEVHPCGHVFIPTLTTHQRMASGSRRVTTVETEHKSCNAADSRGHPANSGEVRSGIGTGKGTEQELGTERNGTGLGTGSAPAKAPNGAGATTDEDTLPLHLRAVQ